MKKFMSFLLMSLLVISFICPTYAESEFNVTEKVVEENGYQFVISEMVDENFCTYRTYEVSNKEPRTVKDEEETKALLIALGQSEENISNLSSEEIQSYANSLSITTMTMYAKYDKDGNMTYITREEALSESQRINAEKLACIKAGITPHSDLDESVLSLEYDASDIGDGYWKFVTNATWLSMPLWRSDDSIGSCAMGFAIDDLSRKGHYSYEIVTIKNGHSSVSKVDEDIEKKDFRNAVEGNWYGSAAILHLPKDSSTPNTTIMCRNYSSHYEFIGRVHDFTTAKQFNCVGSYYHATIAISVNPSVSISTGTPPQVTASIGIDVTGKTEALAIEYFKTYYPDN